jgi:biopolymer transport protein TolQ
MTTDISFLGLILQASLVVQGVMLLLLLTSVASWAIIFRKRAMLRKASQAADEFESVFWSGGDLTGIYRDITGSSEAAFSIAGIFEAGFREFKRLNQQPGIDIDSTLESARRAMRVAQMRETDRLEEGLATLATIGSTSPYVGLFGTVWGIMNSFHGLGNVQSATLAMVAPGISEALVATAMGLFAAIPAVIAYNRFADQLGRMEVRYDTFGEEFTTILQRYAHTKQGGAES